MDRYLDRVQKEQNDLIITTSPGASLTARKMVNVVPRSTNNIKDKISKNQNSLFYPESQTGKVIKSAIQILDPTGISSYPDVYQAGKEMYNNPSWVNAGSLALETFGALPLIGKISKPVKLLKSGSRTVSAGKKLQSMNKAIDTVPELIPGIRQVAQKTQDLTSKFITNPVYNRIPKGSKKYLEAPEYADIFVNSVNGTNSAIDIKQFGDEFYNKYKKQ